MPYSQFTNLETIETNFAITITDKTSIFANIPESEYSDLLSQTLQENISLALAINTEKARKNQIMEVDLNDYFINNFGKIVGILKYLVNTIN